MRQARNGLSSTAGSTATVACGSHYLSARGSTLTSATNTVAASHSSPARSASVGRSDSSQGSQ